MPNEISPSSFFSNDEVRDIIGFDANLTDAELGQAGAAIEGGIAAYMLINFLVFNPVKEEMDQMLSPMNN